MIYSPSIEIEGVDVGNSIGAKSHRNFISNAEVLSPLVANQDSAVHHRHHSEDEFTISAQYAVGCGLQLTPHSNAQGGEGSLVFRLLNKHRPHPKFVSTTRRTRR